jgi:hypothetical protein
MQRGLWEVVEWLPKSHQWSLVLSWHGGHWTRPEYRPLPDSAEPLLRAIAERDWMRHGRRKGAWKAEMARTRPADERWENAKELARKMVPYVQWGRKNHRRNQRLYFSGLPGARREAMNERERALRDALGW